MSWLTEVLPGTGIEASLAQYGAIGVILLLAIYAIFKLFQRQEQLTEKSLARADAQLARETTRADDAEAELAELNKLMREQLVVQLVRATDAISRVLELLTDRNADRNADRRAAK